MKMHKKRLIIINPVQYGQSTDYIKYAEYLSGIFDVEYFCLDQGHRRLPNDYINLHYIPYGKYKKISYPLYFLIVLIYVILHRGVVLSANFSGCRYLKMILFWRKMVVNIRTVSVSQDKKTAELENKRILKDALPFDRIIMISEGGAVQLGLPARKVHIVSLGADTISSVRKDFSQIRLLYVGTLTGRNLIKTLHGLKLFIDVNRNSGISYDIVGDGVEYHELKEYVEQNGLSAIVKMHGRVDYCELAPFFDKCNIGVSFVPMTEWYDYQPPTKTFEYINSGLFCIATATSANKDVVNSRNGVLIDDSADGFRDALNDISVSINDIDEDIVRASGVQYTWKSVVLNQLLPVLEF